MLLALLAAPLSAQSIRGRIVLPDSTTPVVEATIVVRDGAGVVVGRVASGRDGRFAVRLPGAGSFDLQAIRIGFGPVSLPFADMTRGEERTVTLVMTERPLELAAVEVQGDDRCRMSRGDREKFVQTWQLARAALRPHVAVGSSALAVRVLEVRGTEDGPLRLPGGRLIWNPNERYPEADSVGARETYAEAFLGTTPAEVLAEFGYARRLEDSSIVYDVPNPEVVLSEQFLANYCFGVEGGPSGHRDWVGLSFRPMVDVDSLTDIDGTLWVERATGGLRRVEFRYRNLPRIPFLNCVSKNRPLGVRARERRYGPYCREPLNGAWLPTPPLGTGGTIEFATLPSGVWVASEWLLRTPGTEFMDRYDGSVQYDRDFRELVRCRDRPSVCDRVYLGVPRLIVTAGGVAELRLEGLELHRNEATIAAILRVSALQAGTRVSHLAGVVLDEEGRPVSGAIISTGGPVRATLTDSLGRFEIRTLPAGETVLRIRKAGHEELEVRVVLEVAGTAERTIVLPKSAQEPDTARLR